MSTHLETLPEGVEALALKHWRSGFDTLQIATLLSRPDRKVTEAAVYNTLPRLRERAGRMAQETADA